MLIMLAYSIILLGIIVNASDAPQVNNFRAIKGSKGTGIAEAAKPGRVQRRGLTGSEVNYVSLGFSTPVTPGPVGDSLSGEIAQGVYREAWSLCIDSLWNTCVGRCGQSLYGAPYVCACDSLCPAYGDCCLDYELECTYRGPLFNATLQSPYFQHLGEMECISLAQDYDYGVLVVTECSDWWPKGESKLFEHYANVRKRCESPLSVAFRPVEANLGLVFKNFDCYVCNTPQNRNQEPAGQQLPVICRHGDSVMETYRDLCSINLSKAHMHHSTYRVCAYDVNECPDGTITTTVRPGEVTTSATWATSATSTVSTTSESSASVEGRSEPVPAEPAKWDAVPELSGDSGKAPEAPGNSEMAPVAPGSYKAAHGGHDQTVWGSRQLLDKLLDNGTSTNMNDLCSAYSKPVFATRLFGDSQSYKNVHCAHCHQRQTAELYCPSWKVMPASRDSESSGPLIFFETGLNAVNKFAIRDIPASFAILYHFGSDGNQNTMFSSQGQQWWDETIDNCEDDQIWDPFAEVCRQIYCSAEFTLVDFKCVHMYDNSTADGGDVLPENITDVIQNVDLTEVLVILAIELDCCVDEDTEDLLEEQFVDALATSLNITADRFTNFTVYNGTLPFNSTLGCPRDTAVSLILLGPNPADPGPQPSIEKVMASLSYGVALNHLLLHLEDGVTIRVMGLREKVVRYANATGNATDDWCADGRQLYYTSGQFTPITEGNSPVNVSLYIYVNVTGYTYLPGQFIANILFAGDQRSVLANVTGAVVVCDRSYHNNTCVRIKLSPSEYSPLSNGSIMYTGSENITDIYNPGSYEIMANGDALVCVKLPPLPNDTDCTPQSNTPYMVDMEVQGLLTTVLLSVSSLAILVTIVTYALFASLRNLPGWTMLHLAFCLLLYQLIYLSGMRPSVTSEPVACELVAISLHYSIMAFFFWMNVIAFDLFKTFGRKGLLAVATRETTLLPWYALYAYGMPLLLVSCCVAVDYLSVIPDTWVGYGQGEECWIANPIALAIVFAAPTLVIIVVNFIFYVVTVLSIRKIRRKTKLTTGLRSGKSQLLIYTRISTVMGFTWIFGELSGIEDVPYALHDVFSYLFIVLNTSQGAFIFFAFVCNRKIWKLYRNSTFVVRLMDCVDHLRRCKDCKELKCVCQKPIARTISNETCQSIIVDEKSDKSSS